VYMVLVTAIAGGLAGLAPAVETLRPTLAGASHQRDAIQVAGGRWRVRDLLIAGQIAMSFALLASAGLFLRTQSAIRHHDPGLDIQQTLIVPLRLDAAKLPKLLADVHGLPGVRAAALAVASPLETEGLPTVTVRRADRPALEPGRTVAVNSVAPEYFQTINL